MVRVPRVLVKIHERHAVLALHMSVWIERRDVLKGLEQSEDWPWTRLLSSAEEQELKYETLRYSFSNIKLEGFGLEMSSFGPERTPSDDSWLLQSELQCYMTRSSTIAQS